MKKKDQGSQNEFQDIQGLEKQIGHRLRQRRLELGLTQQELGDKLGLSYQQVQKYETGLNRISAGRLYLVAKYLSADLNYFFEPVEKAKNNSQSTRPSLLAISDRGIDPGVQTALANLVQSLSRAKNFR